MEDRLLAQTEEAIEARLTPQNRSDFMKIVVAGLKTATHGGPNSILARIRQSKDPVNDAALGAVNLVSMMSRQSRGTMPPRAFVPAATVLMLHALDFAQKLGIIKITPELVAEATKKITDYIFRAFRISNADVQKAAAAAHGVTQDPQAWQQAKIHAGLEKHPEAGRTPPGQEEIEE